MKAGLSAEDGPKLVFERRLRSVEHLDLEERPMRSAMRGFAVLGIIAPSANRSSRAFIGPACKFKN
jgi:hypothetical protein